jgi:glutamate synthase domain-containing protein 1
MCHNGEINTLRNVSRMRAREELMQSDIFGDDIKKLFPIILMENQTRFYGYGYRIINDWTLVTGSYDDGCT